LVHLDLATLAWGGTLREKVSRAHLYSRFGSLGIWGNWAAAWAEVRGFFLGRFQGGGTWGVEGPRAATGEQNLGKKEKKRRGPLLHGFSKANPLGPPRRAEPKRGGEKGGGQLRDDSPGNGAIGKQGAEKNKKKRAPPKKKAGGAPGIQTRRGRGRGGMAIFPGRRIGGRPLIWLWRPPADPA